MIDAASLDRRLEEMRCALDAAPNEVSASLVIPARQGMDNVARPHRGSVFRGHWFR